MKKGLNDKSQLQRISRNALFSSGGWGASVVLTIIVTPFMVSRLTLDGYGIYALISGLTGYFGLLDIGLGQGVIKFVAEHSRSGEIDSIYDDLNTSLTVQALTGFVGAVALFFCASVLIDYLNVPSIFKADTIFCVRVSAIGFFFSMLAGTLGSVLMGLQRYDLTSKIGTFASILTTLAVVTALLSGYGLKCVVAISASTGLILLYVNMMFVKRHLPAWVFNPAINQASSKRLFNFSFYLLLMNLSGFITTSFTRFIISHYLGPAAVTYYVVSSRITNTIGGLLSNAFGVVFPVFSELAVAADKERLKASFYDASRLFASLSCPLYLLLAVCAAPTLTIWMGREFADKGAVVLAMLAAACLIGALTTVPNHFIIGTGHTRPRAVVSVVIIIYNVIAMPIATKTAGVLGLIVNQLVASILALIMLLVINERLSGFSIKEYLYSSYAFHIAPILITCCSVYYFISTPIEPYGMLGIAMIIGSVYFGLMTYSGWLPVKRLVGALRSKAGD